MADGIGADQAKPASQELAAAGGVHHPGGPGGVPAAAGGEGEDVRRFFVQGDIQVGDTGTEVEAEVFAVPAEQLGLEGVAVELIAGDVGESADEAVAVVLEARVVAAGALPVEAQVVL